MLNLKHRIKNEEEIKKAFFSKFQKNTKFTRIILRHNSGDFKLIVVVSKKIFKQAVKRNRVRRKIIAIFEELKSQDKLLKDTTLAIQVKSKEILHLNKQNLEKEILPTLDNLFSKCKNYKTKRD